MSKSNICRMCLEDIYDGQHISVIETNKLHLVNSKLIQKIYILLGFKIDISVPWPSSICFSCMENIDYFYKFRHMCIEADKKIRNFEIPRPILENVENKNKDDESTVTQFIGYSIEKSDRQICKEDEENCEGYFVDVKNEVNASSSQLTHENNEEKFTGHSIEEIEEFTEYSMKEETVYWQDTDNDEIDDASECKVKNLMGGLRRLRSRTKCCKCPQFFSSTARARLHEDCCNYAQISFPVGRSTGQRKFHCDFCNRSLRDKKLLRLHIIKYHLLPLASTVNCDMCGNYFKTKKLIKRHISMHLATSIQHNKAELNAEFSQTHNKKRRQCHKQIYPIRQQFPSPFRQRCACHICGKTFKGNGWLKNHIHSKHRNDKSFKLFPSTHGSEKINTVKSLKDHNKADKYQWPCNKCELGFNEKGSLICHQAAVHGSQSTVKNFPMCKLCFNFFRYDYELSRHTCSALEAPSSVIPLINVKREDPPQAAIEQVIDVKITNNFVK